MLMQCHLGESLANDLCHVWLHDCVTGYLPVNEAVFRSKDQLHSADQALGRQPGHAHGFQEVTILAVSLHAMALEHSFVL